MRGDVFKKLEEQCTHMYKDIFLKTPLLIYFNFFQIFFPKIEVAKLGMRLICKCGLYAGIYSTCFVIGGKPTKGKTKGILLRKLIFPPSTCVIVILQRLEAFTS